MARAILMEEKIRPPLLNDVLLQILIDTARKEIDGGISVKFLADVYKKTYGRTIARKIFKMVKNLKAV